MRSAIRSFCRKHLYSPNTIRYRVEFPRVLDAFRQIGNQGTVFDGGAGSGQMLRLLHEAGLCKKGIGFEYDPDLYALMVENYRRVPALSHLEGSLLEIPLDDGSVDASMSTQVLEHIEDHHRAAAELARIVKPGGHIVISVPHPPEPYHTPGHIREGYTEDSLKELFPSPRFQHLSTGYSLTRETLNRAIRFQKFPFQGAFLPVGWADCETSLTPAQRQERLPYAITCLFRKADGQ